MDKLLRVKMVIPEEKTLEEQIVSKLRFVGKWEGDSPTLLHRMKIGAARKLLQEQAWRPAISLRLKQLYNKFGDEKFVMID